MVLRPDAFGVIIPFLKLVVGGEFYYVDDIIDTEPLLFAEPQQQHRNRNRAHAVAEPKIASCRHLVIDCRPRIAAMTHGAAFAIRSLLYL